jgi:hypothetical protein
MSHGLTASILEQSLTTKYPLKSLLNLTVSLHLVVAKQLELRFNNGLTVNKDKKKINAMYI